jgi:hypothetical protein
MSRDSELLILARTGLRVGVLDHFGIFDEFVTFNDALRAARKRIANGQLQVMISIRIDADIINGLGCGTDRELMRFEVYFDRVTLVPSDQGGLTDDQRDSVRALSSKELL